MRIPVDRLEGVGVRRDDGSEGPVLWTDDDVGHVVFPGESDDPVEVPLHPVRTLAGGRFDARE